MLSRLLIQNYALIDSLEIFPDKGFISITGETGAGKSILAGAISLLTGKRADINVLKNPDKKCLIEAVWNTESALMLKDIFEKNDLDFESEVIIRREINSNGKSRAFINDTPVSLVILKDVCASLVDMSSQHETIQLFNEDYQLKLYDVLVGNKNLRLKYNSIFKDYKNTKNQISVLLKKEEDALKEKDYIEFQLSEIIELDYKSGELSDLESEQLLLSNAGLITESLISIIKLADGENAGLFSQMEYALNRIKKIEKFNSELLDISTRLQSNYLDIKDLISEMEEISEKAELNPEKLEIINNRINRINSVVYKHRLNLADDIIDFQSVLSNRLSELDRLSNDRTELEKRKTQLEIELEMLSDEISKIRNQNKEITANRIINLAIELGIPHAKFEILISQMSEFGEFGKENIRFLFSANPGSELSTLSQVASGGELSRLLLALKILAGNENNVETMIFDEIDSGISGIVANNVGEKLKNLSQFVQIIVITHLPQIAGKSNQQLKVFKIFENDTTQTLVKTLNLSEREREIAMMISGSEISENALAAARELIK